MVKRFRGCQAGIAATEFALLAPILLALFFGVVEGADALARSRQVTLAVNTLADLAAQESELLTSDADDLFGGIRQIVDGQNAPMTIRLVSVTTDEDGDPVVHWSRDNSGGQPYAPGAAYPKLGGGTLIEAGASIIVAEVAYSYRSKMSRMIIPPINFDRMATRWPRRTVRVQLCTGAGMCTS